jgi:hypothetical protein
MSKTKLPASEWPKTIRQTACSYQKVGEIELHGRYGGAFTAHYRVDSIADGDATLTRVIPESVRNDDGTFSTVWRDA